MTAEISGFKVDGAKLGQPATVQIGYILNQACGDSTVASLNAFDRNSSGEPVRVLEARVTQDVPRGHACSQVIVNGTASSTFSPQVSGAWTAKGIKGSLVTAQSTFSVTD